MLLKERMKAYDVPQKFQEMGIYPYFRTIESEQDTVVKIDGREVLMFGSNSYLGLTIHPKLKEASKAAVDKYGSGCAGSRFLNGTLDLHLELEERLAKFVEKDGALVFSTGFQVNLGVISSLTGRHDYIIIDDLDHACIIDGSRLSFSKVLKYRHNDMASLEKVLQKCDADKVKLIAVDGVFSMEGDLAKLPEIVALAEKYKANIMVDDAHGLGVVGRNGRGTADHFGVTDQVDLIMGTFSKSLASIGGFIAADNDTINYLKHNARSLIFSASIAPANAASVIAALDIMESEPERIQKLCDNTHYAMKLLEEAGFDTGHTETPIIPIFIRDDFKTFEITKMLLEQGVFVNPVVSPAVASTSSLLRYSLMATHTFAQIEESVDKITACAKKLGVFESIEAIQNEG
ncbi:MAG: pyridoxal phosphate-dependent aminotransferase family protein [Bacteroidota bacterium]